MTLIALASSIASQSSTPDDQTLAVARALATSIASQSTTPDTLSLDTGSLPTITESVVGSGTSVSSFTLASWTPAANDLVVIWIAVRQTVSVSSISGNGITFANVAGATRQGTKNQERIECWRGQVASPTSGQITVTMSSSAVAVVAVAVRIANALVGNNGADAIEASAAADTGATDTASPSVNITTLTNNALVLAGVSHRNRAFSVGTGETQVSLNNTIGTGGDETRCSVEYQNKATAGSVTMDGTLAAAIDWSIGAISIKGGRQLALALSIASLSTTPDTLTLAIARALATSIASSSTTPDTLTLAVARALAMSISSLSTTPDTLTLARAMAFATSIASQSTTPDTLTLIALVRFATSIASLSTTPDTLTLARAMALSTSIASTSSTPDTPTLAVARALAMAIASLSTTPDTLTLARAMAMAMSIASQSTTPDTLAIIALVSFATSIASTSSTPDNLSLPVARALAMSIASLSTTATIDFDPILAALAGQIARVAAQSRSFSVLDDRILLVAAQSRAFVVRDSRHIIVAAQSRTFEGKTMALAEIVKAPNAKLDYQIDWSTYLDTGDTIASSSWDVPAGLTSVATSNTTTTATVRLSGGTAGTSYTVTNHVILDSGQEDERSIVIAVQNL